MKDSVKIEDKIEGITKRIDVLILTKFELNQNQSCIKGIFIPTAKEILLQKVPEIIEDGSIEIYSLQYFIESYLQDNHISRIIILNDPIYCSNPLLWNWLKDELTTVADRNPWEKFIKTYHNYVVNLEEQNEKR